MQRGSQTLAFKQQCLDTGAVEEICASALREGSAWDTPVAYSANRLVDTVFPQNFLSRLEVASLGGDRGLTFSYERL